MYDLATALDYFVAINPELFQPAMISDGDAMGLTPEQQTLLEYVKSLRHSNLARLFIKVRK